MAVEFEWQSSAVEASHAYLLPRVLEILSRQFGGRTGGSVLDIGSGNGSMTAVLASKGYAMVGVEPSTAGVALAREAYPAVRFELGDGYEDLRERFGLFDAVVSCEVIEHLLTPGVYLKRIREVMKDGSIAIISTPYHAYLKNVLIAASGKWDHHHHPTREWGHVKFFSRDTINDLAATAGLREVEFHRVGRIPIVAKSMISVFAPSRG